MNVSKRTIIICVVFVILAVQAVILARVFQPAKTGGVSASALIINPGGGVLSNGSDGVRWEFNRAAFSRGDGVFWRNQPYFFDGGDYSIVLTVGGGAGTAIQSINSSSWTANLGNVKFDDITIGNLTGSAILCSSTSRHSTQLYMTGCGGTTGSGSGVITYSKTLSGKVYTLVRTITYVYPE